MYEVQYDPLETFDGQISTETTNTSLMCTNLTGLEEYVEYNISVRAYTREGPGPYSDPVTERTNADGKGELDMNSNYEIVEKFYFHRTRCISPEYNNSGSLFY